MAISVIQGLNKQPESQRVENAINNQFCSSHPFSLFFSNPSLFSTNSLSYAKRWQKYQKRWIACKSALGCFTGTQSVRTIPIGEECSRTCAKKIATNMNYVTCAFSRFRYLNPSVLLVFDQTVKTKVVRSSQKHYFKICSVIVSMLALILWSSCCRELTCTKICIKTCLRCNSFKSLNTIGKSNGTLALYSSVRNWEYIRKT